MQTEWILCPVCGDKTRDRLREDTILKSYPFIVRNASMKR